MSITDELKATEAVLRIPPAKVGSSRPVNQDRVAAQAMIAAQSKSEKEAMQ